MTIQCRAALLLLSISCAPARLTDEPEPNTNLPLRQLDVRAPCGIWRQGFTSSGLAPNGWSMFGADGYARSALLPQLQTLTSPSRWSSLEGYSAQICYPTPVFRQARIVHDTLRVQLDDLNGPSAMAGTWVEAVELPRSRQPVVLDTNNEYDAAAQRSMLQQRPVP